MANIRIGTRASELAVWQAKEVQEKLKNINISSSIVPISSSGDKDLTKPIYELGITGVFTKEIDIALLNKEIDIAVHSLKDVPTILPLGVRQSAVLKRGLEKDVIIINKSLRDVSNTIATGSLRRKAQWLSKYNSDTIVSIRGNVNTRLKKLKESDWNGTIMAKAGLDRLNLLPKNYLDLDWMIPAPAQGAISIQNLVENDVITEIIKKINHAETEICTKIERDFLNKLEGGCTAPIGAHAKIINNYIEFSGIILSIDGRDKIEIRETEKIGNNLNIGIKFAEKIIAMGGNKILNSLKNEI
jgi:hydroxymethylbilane synthase|tara:strand:+ start:1078 stop:1980 length:903 start_codon:yes stop_codon:yes gene_type:complete